MSAATKNLSLEQGVSFRVHLTWKAPLLDVDGNVVTIDGVAQQGDPIDITGAEAHMQIRQSVGGAVLLELTSLPGGGITLGGTAGTIAISMTPEMTARLAVKRAKYDLDLIFPDRDDAVRLLKGQITVELAITREVDPLPLGGADPVYGLTT